MSWSPQKIVVPVDFSTESLAAVDKALEIGGQTASVFVIHVLNDLSPVEPGEIWFTVDAATRRQRTLQALRNLLSDPKYGHVQFEVQIGDPGHKIAEYCADVGGELIVMPSHGRAGLRRVLIGSVAERVTRHSHCPVLILRQ